MSSSRIQKSPMRVWFAWRQGIKIFIFLVLLSSSLFVMHKIKGTKQFPIKQVKVYGVAHLNHSTLQAVLTPLVSKGFFATEVELIKEQILPMPWVADVSVRRIWPDQLVVVVTERNPIARWNKTGLLSSAGDIFSPDMNTFPAELPHFLGPEGEQIQMLSFYQRISQLLQPLHLKIAQLELTPYLSWSVIFTSGMKVQLGYKDVLTRLNHFVKVYPKIVGERLADVDCVDLRYSNGLAVRWKTVS